MTAPGATRWWLIRHAPVATPDEVYGQRDVPADLRDRAAVRALAPLLPADAVWLCSPLSRTRDTADVLRAAAGLTDAPVPDPALAEQHFGTWQGRTPEAIAAEDPDGWRAFWRDPGHLRPPGGESFADVGARVAPAIHRHAREHPGRDLIAVVHGGTVRAAVAEALDLDPGAALRLVVDTLSCTRLDRLETADGVGWRVGAINHVPGRLG